MIETVIKRDGSVTTFQSEKIYNAVYRCLYEGLGQTLATSGSVAEEITSKVVAGLNGHGNSANVEEIQNVVEKALMECGYHEAARAYILYREEHRKSRQPQKVVDPGYEALVKSNRQYLKHPLQEFQFYNKYSRWNETKGRRETWTESIGRVTSFFRNNCEYPVHDHEWEEIHNAILNMEIMPSMRAMQMAGPAAERCNVCIYNCSYLPIKDIRCFSEVLYILMQGAGVGFSVESEYVEDLPRIKKQKGLDPIRCYVEDSTEGWCDALHLGISAWFEGEDVLFDTSGIREAGTILKTKGGRASGPEPLEQLLGFARSTILARQGRRLRPIDCLDICNYCGWIVQVGGVRRAAEICIFDTDDELVRYAKHGEFWVQNGQRTQSNNSIVFEEKPTQIQFLENCWLPLMKSGSGEPGFFNREAANRTKPKRRKKADWGTNPCAEIVLRPFEFCNLSIIAARPEDTLEDLKRKAVLATKIGTIQSTFTRFNYIREEWKRNCDEERLLGVDINGWQDNPLLRYDSPVRNEVMETLRKVVLETNQEMANRFGINVSAASTTVKPGGNSSSLLFCAPSLGFWEHGTFIRRVRAGRYDPVSRLLMECGVPWNYEVGQTAENYTTVVFEFPVKAPEGSPTYRDITAIDQFKNWLGIKRNWTEHNPSCTIRMRADEWMEIGSLVYNNWDEIGGLSFLPQSEHVYALAPYQGISEEEYNERISGFPEIPWHELPKYEKEDTTTVSREYACVSGESCSL